jgi:uncharacterized protein involved in exopolysaccharide biosynthesis
VTTAVDAAEVDLGTVVRVLWSQRYVILLLALLGGGVAAALALAATVIYRAEAVIVPAHDDSMAGSSSLASRFGGIASLAGVNLAGSSEGTEGHAVLQSRRLVEEFIKRHGPPEKIFSHDKKPPTLWSAVRQFQGDVLVIREDKTDGLTRVSIDWTDPVVAAAWANDVVALCNELVRTRALNEAKRNIDYLNEQIAKTNVIEVRRVMYNLIESETKTLMLANGRIEYAFKVVDPAVPPEMRISPRRTMMVLAGLVLGGLLGCFAAFLRWQLRRRSSTDPL